MISYRQLCQIGLDCPHHSMDECGDEICIHPYTRDNCPEYETFGMVDSICECPLLEFGSELYAALSAYQYDRERFNEFVEIRNKRCDREYRYSSYADEYNERVAAGAYIDYRRLYDA